MLETEEIFIENQKILDILSKLIVEMNDTFTDK